MISKGLGRSRAGWRIGLSATDKPCELSSDFLHLVRGQPALRGFGLAHDQVTPVGEVSQRYRKATMETLRVSYPPGSVLELAPTLGVALVAVTADVQLVDGGLVIYGSTGHVSGQGVGSRGPCPDAEQQRSGLRWPTLKNALGRQ